jgi:hypothetical protein
MHKTALFFCLIFLLPLWAEPVFRDLSPYVGGRARQFADPFGRLPAEMETRVRPPVWRLSRNTAGLAAHFFTDATELHMQWELLNNFHMVHMAGTGIRGVDLYVREGKDWAFIANGRPYEAINTSELIKGMEPEMREYLLYCPLYDGLRSLKIGTNPGAQILTAERENKPLLFYGTSITQGGCVSRPGMAYPAIVGRELGRESINLGFSGNGRMDPEIMDFIAGVDADCFILDCLPNMDLEMIRSHAEAGIRKILETHPGTPVLLVPNIMPEGATLNAGLREEIMAENRELEAIYTKLRKEYKHLHLIPFRQIRHVANEATVDGIHLTDLGQFRLAKILAKRIKRSLR